MHCLWPFLRPAKTPHNPRYIYLRLSQTTFLCSVTCLTLTRWETSCLLTFSQRLIVNVMTDIDRQNREQAVSTLQKGVNVMTGNLHNCSECGGYLALSYIGWNCCLCSRKFLIQNSRMSEMWWRNLSVEENDSEAVAVAETNPMVSAACRMTQIFTKKASLPDLKNKPSRDAPQAISNLSCTTSRKETQEAQRHPRIGFCCAILFRVI